MVDGLVPVAAPLTTPVDVSNASPTGRVGEIAKVIGAAPVLLKKLYFGGQFNQPLGDDNYNYLYIYHMY